MVLSLYLPRPQDEVRSSCPIKNLLDFCNKNWRGHFLIGSACRVWVWVSWISLTDSSHPLACPVHQALICKLPQQHQWQALGENQKTEPPTSLHSHHLLAHCSWRDRPVKPWAYPSFCSYTELCHQKPYSFQNQGSGEFPRALVGFQDQKSAELFCPLWFLISLMCLLSSQ